MKCYKCGNFLFENDFCAECGADVSVYKKIVKKSNELYNKALKMAKDRNLSGAIECLTVSIKMYKGNINAHNLLGLIYCEMGEYTMALAQWIISMNIQSESNLASRYIDELQHNRQDLNMMNVTIKKYNKAIAYVGQGNYDLAEISLKKLLNDNDHLVKGYQLLSLLLMRKGKYVEARNILKKARNIDQGNPVTMSYLAAAGDGIKDEEQDLNPTALRNKRVAEKETLENEHAPLSGDDVIIPKSSYKEYNPTTMTIIKIIIGVVIGAALIFFVVMPAKTKSLRGEYAEEISDLSEQVEILTAEKAELESQVEALSQDNKNKNDAAGNVLTALSYYDSGDYNQAFNYISKVKAESLAESQRSYFNKIKSDIVLQVSKDSINEAITAYNSEDYTTAKNKLQDLYNTGVQTADVLYYLGRSYDYLEMEEETLKYLRQYVTDYPDDANVVIANQIINSWTN